MTFIIAIQLNDSIIVTADNKEVVLKEDHSNELLERSTSKPLGIMELLLEQGKAM